MITMTQRWHTFLKAKASLRKAKQNKKITLAYPTCYIFVFLWNLVPFCKIYLWGKDIFTFYQHCMKSVQIQCEYRKLQTRNSSVFGHFSCSAGIAITTGDWWNQRKKPSTDKFDYRKKWWKWTDGLLCPWNLSSFLDAMTTEWHCIFDSFFSHAY